LSIGIKITKQPWGEVTGYTVNKWGYSEFWGLKIINTNKTAIH